MAGMVFGPCFDTTPLPLRKSCLLLYVQHRHRSHLALGSIGHKMQHTLAL